MSRFVHSRRRTSVFVGATLLALAFGVSVGLAKSGPSQYSHLKLFLDPGALCPPLVSGKDPHAFGEASLKRSKSTVTIKVHLHGAVDGKYIVLLGLYDPSFPPPSCVAVGSATEFKVKGGDGNGSGTFSLPDVGQVFAVGAFNEDTGDAYVTDPVKLGST
jgi:hypothetical protein